MSAFSLRFREKVKLGGCIIAHLLLHNGSLLSNGGRKRPLVFVDVGLVLLVCLGFRLCRPTKKKMTGRRRDKSKMDASRRVGSISRSTGCQKPEKDAENEQNLQQNVTVLPGF